MGPWKGGARSRFWRWGRGHPFLNLRGHPKSVQYLRGQPQYEFEFSALELKIFFNHSEVLKWILLEILHLVRLRAFKMNFLQPWWSVKGDFTQNPSFWCDSELLNWNFSFTIINYWSRFHPKILHFGCFSAFELKSFFNHGEALKWILLKILHPGTFQST